MGDREQCLFPLSAEQAEILARCGTAFSYAVKEKFNFMAILHNIEEAGSFSNTSSVFHAENRYSTNLSSTVEISVWKDDLIRHKVEAVVNAANENLQHGGGLAHALCKAGGPEIQQWSDQLTKVNGPVKTGKAVLTPAGNLPCKYIIHAVGPRVPQNPSLKEIKDASPLLYKAITSVLEIVVHQNIRSVAIPALSSGLFNFPIAHCADIIVKAIKQFHDYGAFQNKNLEIHLVNNDEPSVQEMERATREIFSPLSTSKSYSGAVKGSNPSKTSSSSNSWQFENIMLHLKRGAIQDETVDVLVNTIAADCNLSQGLVSGAILEKAGNNIQKEIYSKKNSTPFYSSNVFLYETKGYGLNCQAVFHTICASRSAPKAKEILFKVVLECLKKTALRYHSISFPAIGTGNLSFKKSEVATIMTDALAEFAKQNPKQKLDVYFVVYPKDNDMMEAFETEMKMRKGHAKSPEVHHRQSHHVTSFASAAIETPLVEFQSITSCNEALREAKEWTCNILQLSKKRIIQNNHIIYLGQKEHENLLTLQTIFNVHIEEFFNNGNGGIIITGSSLGVSCAAIEAEFMLCRVQEEFAQAEEQHILYCVVRWSCKDEPWIQTPAISAILEKAYMAGEEKQQFKNYMVDLYKNTLIDTTGRVKKVERKCLLAPLWPPNSMYSRTPVSMNNFFEKEGKKAFRVSRLNVLRAEKLENIALKQLFEKNGQRVKGQPERLYQRVSAQYCDLICRIGFQKEFAPPPEQKYGSGIYFSSSVEGALKLWNNLEQEQYIYIIQAKVLTGESTIGSSDMILPPPLKGDPLERYDSVSDKVETHVIFSGQQALPEYLIICGKSSQV